MLSVNILDGIVKIVRGHRRVEKGRNEFEPRSENRPVSAPHNVISRFVAHISYFAFHIGGVMHYHGWYVRNGQG